MRWRGAATALLALAALVGCATRADLVSQDRALRGLINQQRKDMQSVQRELERLRADVEEGGGKRRAGQPDRLTLLEQRVQQLEDAGATPETPPVEEGVPGQESPAASAPPTATPPPAPPVVAARPPQPPQDDAWRGEVEREQAAAGSAGGTERSDYVRALDGVAAGDCAKAIPQLNGFASQHKESPLADNAVYWAARCYQRRGDQNQAISKFYDVVTRYPKGDRAAAALWAQGNLFVAIGDSPDARLAFSKLIRDYPQSEEAAKARQKLTELEN